MSKFAKVGDFAEVLDGSYGIYGVKKGDIIYLAGDATIQTDAEKDPYALRKIFLAAFLKDKHIDVDQKPFTIDGKRLKPVSSAKQKKLDDVRIADFKEIESSDA